MHWNSDRSLWLTHTNHGYFMNRNRKVIDNNMIRMQTKGKSIWKKILKSFKLNSPTAAKHQHQQQQTNKRTRKKLVNFNGVDRIAKTFKRTTSNQSHVVNHLEIILNLKVELKNAQSNSHSYLNCCFRYKRRSLHYITYRRLCICLIEYGI